MCRYCHNLYDNGFLSIYNGLLQVSTLINQYDLCYKKINQSIIIIYKTKIFLSFIINIFLKVVIET